ncbi:hypothetical protein PanWU01x14_135260 [Parasponia andersonii]|uniref:Transmembrane protein n=1 Tax=Parasponia andersonii TaxID=3476 RepID=A0A2P5CP69_PARAD|nr:hypothetical protein PanWU01x14_135260 [Parasponia andersonii]
MLPATVVVLLVAVVKVVAVAAVATMGIGRAWASKNGPVKWSTYSNLACPYCCQRSWSSSSMKTKSMAHL